MTAMRNFAVALLMCAAQPVVAGPADIDAFIALTRTPAAQCVPNIAPLAVGKTSPDGQRLAAVLDKKFPAELMDIEKIETTAISRPQLTALVTYLGCVASWNGDVFVVDTAATLFASTRHGARAFAVLDRQALDRKSSAATRAAASEFRTQMRNDANPK